jgi:LacI family transcriptional regulator
MGKGVYYTAEEVWERSRERSQLENLMPTTLEDNARLSGVSRSTVSRVINGQPHVDQVTRDKVLEIIRSVNFQPNLAARSLAAGRTHVLGLVIPKSVTSIFSDPYFPLVIQGVASACNALDWSVMLWLADPEYERRTISQILHNGLIDGVIVSSMMMDDPLIERLSESERPFITIGRHPTNEQYHYIDVDNRCGTFEGVAHILKTGRKRIAMITGPKTSIASWDRVKGYKDALSQHGLPVLPELMTNGDFSDAGGYMAMQRLLPHNPDAVFAASDAIALAAIRVIHEAGLRIPEDIAVVGFDDIPSAATSNPPLTTIWQPIQRTGSLAAETLIDVIEHPDSEPRHIVLPTKLIVRSSC